VSATLRPRSIALIAVTVIVGLLGLVAAGALARDAQPPPDATPGAVGVSGPELGALEPAAAPGYRLVMAETVFAPGAYVTMHTHPTAIIVCVQSGALGFAIQHGAATVTRGGTGETPETTEPLALGAEVVLEPRDCVAFDQFAAHTVHTAWNASDGTTVLWETHLVKIGEPFTTFVNEHGTPVP
jgi:quercetin dioxygenase-like cupin family protein